MYRERLTITLDHDLLGAIDSLIDKETLRNRSQTIEHLLREGIGLHELSKAFIFLSSDFNQEAYEKAIKLCATSGITHLFVGIPTELKAQESELLALANEAFAPLTPTIEPVPLDFGTAGALVLKKALLTAPFLTIWPQNIVPLPVSLLSAYIFHRAHNGLLTELIHFHDTYAYSGVSIVEPELINRIPAGIADLQETVFPPLAKEAKVKGYLYAN